MFIASPSASRAAAITPQIAYLVEAFSSEFHDAAHRQSNQTQAARLWHASGLNEEWFCQRLYEAAALTRERLSLKPGNDQFLLKSPMSYFFSVLRDLLRLNPRSN